jgi:hypothetical protein
MLDIQHPIKNVNVDENDNLIIGGGGGVKGSHILACMASHIKFSFL